MAHKGRIYRRGLIYYLAYRWDGREHRESARSADRAVAEGLLAQRLRERPGPTPTLTFDHLAAWYLDDYVVRRLLHARLPIVAGLPLPLALTEVLHLLDRPVASARIVASVGTHAPSCSAAPRRLRHARPPYRRRPACRKPRPP